MAAILFPVFSRARENARKSTCQSNLKQLGLGFMQYVQDYDERYPPLVLGASFTTAPYYNYWMVLIQPYLKNSGVIACPSIPAMNFPTNYSVISNLGPYGYNFQVFSNVLQARIDQPAATIMLGDAAEVTTASMALPPDQWVMQTASVSGGVANRGYPKGMLTFPWTSATAASPYYASTSTAATTDWFQYRARPMGRHMDGANFAFGDGHVKWLKVQSVVMPVWGAADCLYDN